MKRSHEAALSTTLGLENRLQGLRSQHAQGQQQHTRAQSAHPESGRRAEKARKQQEHTQGIDRQHALFKERTEQHQQRIAQLPQAWQERGRALSGAALSVLSARFRAAELLAGGSGARTHGAPSDGDPGAARGAVPADRGDAGRRAGVGSGRGRLAERRARGGRMPARPSRPRSIVWPSSGASCASARSKSSSAWSTIASRRCINAWPCCSAVQNCSVLGLAPGRVFTRVQERLRDSPGGSDVQGQADGRMALGDARSGVVPRGIGSDSGGLRGVRIFGGGGLLGGGSRARTDPSAHPPPPPGSAPVPCTAAIR